MRARLVAAIVGLAALVAAPPVAALGGDAVRPNEALRSVRTREPGWEAELDRIVGDAPVSVALGLDGRWLYRNLAGVRRIPASNEKLLLSMAMLERLPPETVLPTQVMTAQVPVDGVLTGDLWIVGSGDPEVGPETMTALAQSLVGAGLLRVEGSVMGSLGPFARDWWAVGWRSYFDEDEVPFPTALTYRGNVGPDGGHIEDPERRAAAALTKALGRLGVGVSGEPGMGTPPKPLTPLASVDSAPLLDLVHRMNVDSLNFHAEVLGKALGAARIGRGSIANGARAIDRFTASHGAPGFEHHDASGLSYANRVTAKGIVRLLWAADAAPWGELLREALPTGGEGTLEDRLPFVRFHAKTGTLSDISALSGWVWLRHAQTWAEFSIVSRGIPKYEAVWIEDRIVRSVSREAA
jgi:serine-type D-Ala-D-Ala carboxypeptidase/endopeptidase (penicillin-binding protein 4)